MNFNNILNCLKLNIYFAAALLEHYENVHGDGWSALIEKSAKKMSLKKQARKETVGDKNKFQLYLHLF